MKASIFLDYLILISFGAFLFHADLGTALTALLILLAVAFTDAILFKEPSGEKEKL